MNKMWYMLLLQALALMDTVRGHGRLLVPAARGSAAVSGGGTPDYNTNGLNCGGFARHYSVNGGRCGICGDPWDMKTPRNHELGGKYGRGMIAQRYRCGETITALVEISAHHKGYWQLRLCPDPTRNDQKCFDENLLELKDGGTEYYPSSARSKFEVKYKLPTGLTCEHCVLQWRYTAGNNWGKCKNGTQGLGCGDQEQFYSCSDISIGNTGSTQSENEPHEISNTTICSQYMKESLRNDTDLNKMCNNYIPGTSQQSQHDQPTSQQPQLNTTPATKAGHNNHNSIIANLYEDKNKLIRNILKDKLKERRAQMAALINSQAAAQE